MINKVNIAVDAMGGENSPKKIIEGINISLQSNQENFFFIYGQQDLLEKEIAKNKLVQQYSEIINTKDVIADDESPLTAAKRGKESSMWKAIESQKENKSDIVKKLAFFPGAGQFYNNDYLKGIMFFTSEAYSISQIIKFSKPHLELLIQFLKTITYF